MHVVAQKSNTRARMSSPEETQASLLYPLYSAMRQIKELLWGIIFKCFLAGSIFPEMPSHRKIRTSPNFILLYIYIKQLGAVMQLASAEFCGLRLETKFPSSVRPLAVLHTFPRGWFQQFEREIQNKFETFIMLSSPASYDDDVSRMTD